MPKKGEVALSIVLRIIAAGLLFWALGRHPYDYYTLLRWVVCGTTVFCLYLSVKAGNSIWTWGFGILAFLFNPIIPVHLSRNTWAIVDTATAVALLFSILLFKLKSVAINT
ncbi:MAG: hypothetical protein PHR28_08970 [candidate division Zixibacteria bacterium]|nr:hypothetical protein [candidate division Zixibacteria bacterium]